MALHEHHTCNITSKNTIQIQLVSKKKLYWTELATSKAQEDLVHVRGKRRRGAGKMERESKVVK